MRLSRPVLFVTFGALFGSAWLSRPVAQQAPPTGWPLPSAAFGELKWRSIGPYRGGRTKAITGVPGRPGLFYIGVNNGGVWKTEDYGRTWRPIFDDQPSGSIGDVAVSPSNPDVVYVGSGEGLQRPDLSVGDGMYKSVDGGRTWTHLGLRDGQQIPRVVVDPRNPDRVFVAVLGHPYGPNEERGVFRSADGGRSFQKVLYKDENTGASELELDPSNPDVVYAGLWESRQGPWENGAWVGTNGGLFKSTDGGSTWKQLKNGFDGDVTQVDVAIAPSNPRRLYATVAFGQRVGIYRSDDAGESWQVTTEDARPAGRIGGGDLPVLAVHPKNPDVVFSASTVTWKSTDAGRTWTGIRGAPGGDDYQRLWIDPDNPDVIAAASDQGAVISVTGGRTWSSWYTQPTAQLYHVAADNAFPYRLCSGQQESGSACVASRGNDGAITMREWHPVGVDEYGFAAPDPLDPDVVFGGRSVTRYDRRTGQLQTVGPVAGGRGGAPPAPDAPSYRTVRTQPVMFSPADPRTLYFANNYLWKTINGGRTWTRISGDLTRKTYEVPASIGKYRDQDTARPVQRGVIYGVGPSPLSVNRIWAGTDDGLIHTTADAGGHWSDVTPSDIKPWQKVAGLDAGHFDLQTAYAAINTLRLDDMTPHIYRTHDGGKTWTHITNGMSNGAPVNAVREDPKRKGLLYAATETQVWVSFDDGDNWQSLRLNMPASSVRDLIVKGDDLAVATHGRGFWILDDISPLRQMDAKTVAAPVHLFEPQTAYRVRFNMNTDTPLPADEPMGQNPPDGAIVSYWLAADSGPVTLEVVDATGTRVRKYSSDDKPVLDANPPVPLYWYRQPQVLSSGPGLHRFLWDMHYDPLPGGGGRGGLPIAATPNNTVPPSNAPWVAPGQYTLKLTAGGQSSTQPITVKLDPRVKTPALAIAQQSTLSRNLYTTTKDLLAAAEGAHQIHARVLELEPDAGSFVDALKAFDAKVVALEPPPVAGGGRGGRGAPGGGRGGPGGGGDPNSLSSLAASLSGLIGPLQAADAAPTAVLLKTVTERQLAAREALAKVTRLEAERAALNAKLKAAGLKEITRD